MFAILLTLCTPLCALSPQAPTGATATIDTLSLEPLLAPHPAQPLPPWGSMLRGKSETVDHLLGADASGRQGVDGLLELLRSRHPRPLEAGTLQLVPNGRGLLLLGQEADVAAVRATVLAALHRLSQPIELEFAAWDAADRETPPAMMTAEEFVRFTGNRAPLWRTVGRTRSGDALAQQRMRWSSYVRDLQVEVAQKQSLSCPVTDRYAEGGHALVRPHLLLGNEIVLQVQYATAQRRGIVRTVQTGLAGAADIELPTLETSFGIGSGRVRSGGALAVTMRGHAGGGGQLVLTFRATAVAGPGPELPEDLAVWPIGALRSRSLQRHQPVHGGPEDAGGSGPVAIDQLLELVQATVGECQAVVFGDWLLVQADREALQRGERLVQALQERTLRNAVVHHQGTLQAADNTTTGSTSPLHELVLPTLADREAFAARVLETNAITGFEPMIAQEASLLDPNVERVQSGCWLQARVTFTGDQAHLATRLSCEVSMAPPTRTILPGGGVWMPGELAMAATDHHGPVRNGQSIGLGDGPSIQVEGRSYRSALATTVRW